MTDTTTPMPKPKVAGLPRHVQSGPVQSQVEPEPRSERGFRATLHDVGLWGLVQLRCESRARSVVCITSPRGIGYLYFADGQIVHAAYDHTVGERAALQILAWSEGTWDTCERAWPTQASISTTWQGLLLRAAQLEDEQRREAPAKPASSAENAHARTSGVLPLTSPAARTTAQPQAPAAKRTPPQAQAAEPAEREPSSMSYRREDFAHAVRMDAHGAVLTGHGAVDEHATLGAYACRLGDLMGELLGMGALVAVDSTLRGSERCLIFRDPSRDIVVLRPRPHVELHRLKSQLQL